MKFGHLLLVEEQAAPKELQGRFLKYKALKKMLKRRIATTTTSQDSPRSRDQQALETEKEFLRMLRAQLKDIDRKFASDAEAILSHYDVVGGQKSKNPLQTLLTCQLVPRKSKSPEALLKLQNRVFWTKKFAELNATALRKIAKKRDKLCGGNVGSRFLQACFKGQVAIHAILSQPLRRELAAVEQLLTQRLTAVAPPAAQLASLPPPLPAEEEVPATEAAAEQMEAEEPDRDLTCAICMDVLYKPVALECGHIYCARCAVCAAVGHDKSIGDAGRLLTTIAAYSAAYTNRACPACRSTVHGNDGENVFWQIRRMKHLDLLIQQKYPEDWQRRKKEDDEDQAELRKKRASNSYFKAFSCC